MFRIWADVIYSYEHYGWKWEWKIYLGQHFCRPHSNISVHNPNPVGMFLKFHSDKSLFTKLLFWKLLKYFSIFPEHSGCLARTEECLLMSVLAKLHFLQELGKCWEKDIYKVGQNQRVPGKMRQHCRLTICLYFCWVWQIQNQKQIQITMWQV